MAGSAISRALDRVGYHQQLKPSRPELDLLDPLAVQHWFAVHQPTVVVLAAAKVGGIQANNSYPADFLLENIEDPNPCGRNGLAIRGAASAFLGSSCIYPKFAEQPIKEEALLCGPLEPTNECYAIAKIAGIKLCEALRKQHEFDAISLMPTNLYGPGDNYHSENSHVFPALISRFHKAVSQNQQTVMCWGTGTPLREFLYVDDLGEASVFALENWKPDADEPIFLNVGTGLDLSIRELAEAVAQATGFKGEIQWDTSKPDGTPKKQLDVSRLKAMGWQASISLEDGLSLAYQDFQKALIEKSLRV